MAHSPIIYKSGSAFFRRKAAATVLFFLGRAIRCLYKLDSSIRAEIDGLPEGLIFTINATKGGPALNIQKQNGIPVIVKNSESRNSTVTGSSDEQRITLEFKSISDALLVLLGNIGPAQAYAQHRFILYGDIFQAMPLVRCLFITEAYLFPRFITRKFLTGPIPLEVSKLSVYMRLFKN